LLSALTGLRLRLAWLLLTRIRLLVALLSTLLWLAVFLVFGAHSISPNEGWYNATTAEVKWFLTAKDIMELPRIWLCFVALFERAVEKRSRSRKLRNPKGGRW
jgi:hypothetical protein